MIIGLNRLIRMNCFENDKKYNNDGLVKRLLSALIVTPVFTGVTKKAKNDVMTQPVSPV
jgi:hypothetical protein